MPSLWWMLRQQDGDKKNYNYNTIVVLGWYVFQRIFFQNALCYSQRCKFIQRRLCNSRSQDWLLDC
jgi:hypothetical protein